MVSESERLVQFRLDAVLLEKYLSKYPIDQRNQIAKHLFTNFINGKNTPTIQSENTKSNSILTIKEKLDKVKLANETLKAWNQVKTDGGTPEDLHRLVNYGEIPNFENTNPTTCADEKPKLSFSTFGETVKYTAKQILQEDKTFRCLRCNRLIPIFKEIHEQIDTFVKHINDTHGELTTNERSQLMGLYQK